MRVSLLLGLLWACGVAAGLRTLQVYRATPGRQSAPPARWPESSPAARHPGRFSLVMLAHPRCPCSRASVGELGWIMARAGGRVDAHVFFIKPDGSPSGWEKSDLWRAAAAIPGVAVHLDAAGAAAKAFGAETSGQTVLYDGAGALRFSGGITAGRGHAGASSGREAVRSLLAGAGGVRGGAPVFGCALVAGQSEIEGWWEQWKL